MVMAAVDRAESGQDPAASLIEPVARPAVRRRIRPDSVWAEARKAWEDGETARSVARRYDVGVPALWKRREAEGWKRPDPDAGPVEPAEGWDAFAARELEAFEGRLTATRELATDLAGMMRSGVLTDAPLWHLSFLLVWRAENLGAEVAAADREQALAKGSAWAEAVWDADGRIRPLEVIDRAMMRRYRDTWRDQVGLPDRAAESWP